LQGSNALSPPLDRPSASAWEGEAAAAPAHDLTAEARARDPDRWLCALFVPAEQREAAMALLLLNHELARIPDVATQPMTGLIRYQWWRDAVEEAAAGRPRAHPIPQALAPDLAAGRLDPAELIALIDARESELEPPGFERLADLEQHIGSTAGALQAVLAGLLGADAAGRDAARTAGLAFGLVGVARSSLPLAGTGRSWLPRELMREQGAGPDSIEPSAPVLLALARRALTLARSLPHSGRTSLPAQLPAILARHYARRLIAAGGDPAQAAGLRRGSSMPIRLWWASLTGRV
jgi:phytoene synthase